MWGRGESLLSLDCPYLSAHMKPKHVRWVGGGG